MARPRAWIVDVVMTTQQLAQTVTATNHPNFSLPIVEFGTKTFGTLNQTPDVAAGNPRLGDGGPRVIQFGLKLIF